MKTTHPRIKRLINKSDNRYKDYRLNKLTEWGVENAILSPLTPLEVF